MPLESQIAKSINESKYISRDLSWIKFNERVLEQAKDKSKTILERLKFMAITESNLDEFMMVRVGSLYKYLDYQRKRIDYCGLRENTFKEVLFKEVKEFTSAQHSYFSDELRPKFKKNGFDIIKFNELNETEMRKVAYYFSKTIYPMLTPMVFDGFHTFPILMNKILILGVTTIDSSKTRGSRKYSFIQIPQNLPRYFDIERDDTTLFLPLEDIIKQYIKKLYKNIEIEDCNLFRVTRNADFDYEEYDESENEFIEELKKKLKGRKTGRVVRLEIEENFNEDLLEVLSERFELEEDNIFVRNDIFDFNSLWTIIKNKNLSELNPKLPKPVKPVGVDKKFDKNMLEFLKDNDLLLHHPYQDMEPLLRLLEQAAIDPEVLAIKITIYRLADDSRITNALVKASENGKHVSVLFEVKARFDEENNLREGKRLQKAGCFVIYGVSHVKTHTKLLMIVRKDKRNNVTRYVHMSSGNYNEDTSKIYTDTGYLTTQRVYGNDISEFFNVITGHSMPDRYRKLITTPGDMRKKLITMIRKEAVNHQKGLASGIAIKVNSLEDREVIDELYKASIVGVKIKLIIRGICCIRPGRKGLSDNIEIKSIVGNLLEHTRIFYFHNDGDPKIYGGSADIMVRSFDKRIESLYLVEDFVKQQMINIMDYSLQDEANSFVMQEDGAYVKMKKSDKAFNCHKEFYKLTLDKINASKVF